MRVKANALKNLKARLRNRLAAGRASTEPEGDAMTKIKPEDLFAEAERLRAMARDHLHRAQTLHDWAERGRAENAPEVRMHEGRLRAEAQKLSDRAAQLEEVAGGPSPSRAAR